MRLVEHEKHLQQQRQTERDRKPKQAQIGTVSTRAARFFYLGPGLDAFARVVSRFADDGGELLDAGEPGLVAHPGGLAGKIDFGVHALKLVQYLFDARGTGRASHAEKSEFGYPIRNRVAGFADRFDHTDR